MICVVIMAGGRGERFWPKSRANKPKQFTDITGSGNMLYLTYRRAAKMVSPDRIFVVTGEEYRDATSESLPDLPEENIIFEPEGRNTAPCIGLAAIVLEHRFPGSVMVVVPADHYILDEDKFVEDLRTAIDLARNTGGLITLGVKPTRPETGYGYLKTGNAVGAGDKKTAFEVSKFVEKPNVELALQFLSEGSYLWNAGIFVWETPVILEAFKSYLPEIYKGLSYLRGNLGSKRFNEILKETYRNFPKVSIDYAIMEKANRVYTVPGDFRWDDVGTWKALERVLQTDQNSNIIQGEVIALETRDCIVDAGKRMIAVIGAQELVIVDTADITFVCDKNKLDMVRELLEEIRRRNKVEYL